MQSSTPEFAIGPEAAVVQAAPTSESTDDQAVHPLKEFWYFFSQNRGAVLGLAIALWIRWDDRHKRPPSTPQPHQ